jgi:hypothetical protein
MIKYLKKLWKKFFRKTSDTLPENVGEKTVQHTSTNAPVIIKSKPIHCTNHNRFKKSCPDCLIAVGGK